MKKKKENKNEEVSTEELQENETPETQESELSNEEELEIQLVEAKDKYLRLFAEFDNFKKRNTKERMALISNAAQDTISSLLPVLDDFDRADNNEEFSEGVTLVHQKLITILEGKGLKKMLTTGEVFDAEFHEAITKIPAPNEDMKGKIIDTIEPGYSLNDKIIRYAKVVVGE